MATIISIETSTEVCSVALSKEGTILFEKVCPEGQAHSTKLAPFIQEVMDFCKDKGLDIDAVAVSSGPGSYTGLRIGVSTAKGLCFGLNKPLIAIDTLQLMALAAKKQIGNSDALLCPMIDARRMEVYTAFFDQSLNNVRATAAEIIDENSFSDLLSNKQILFFGNGSNKCKNTLQHTNAKFVDGIVPLASNMVSLAEAAYNKQDFKDVAYFEPAYLKEFVATVSKNKVLGLDN